MVASGCTLLLERSAAVLGHKSSNAESMDHPTHPGYVSTSPSLLFSEGLPGGPVTGRECGGTFESDNEVDLTPIGIADVGVGFRVRIKWLQSSQTQMPFHNHGSTE